ncbi:MAG: GNAT family N-acetyltransferase [Myxococcota bacterium]|nr:GNAT family N-acetyltransferase [Myxococcota bacterium]
MSVEVHVRRGDAIVPILPALARLRIEIFREFPYLYDGDLAYEGEYLARYAERPGALIVTAEVATEAGAPEVVGASTGVPLAQELEVLQRPFLDAGLDVGAYFYGGESILRTSHRGRGIYAKFLDAREEHARALGHAMLTFCAVERPKDHPRRPVDYVPLDDVWRHFGYTPRPTLRTSFRWRDVDAAEETEHPMVFWEKSLV